MPHAFFKASEEAIGYYGLSRIDCPRVLVNDGLILSEELLQNRRLMGDIYYLEDPRESKAIKAPSHKLKIEHAKGINIKPNAYGIGRFLTSGNFGPCRIVLATLSDGSFGLWHAPSMFATSDICRDFFKHIKGKVVSLAFFEKSIVPKRKEEDFAIRGAVLHCELQAALERHGITGIQVSRFVVPDYTCIVADANQKKVFISNTLDYISQKLNPDLFEETKEPVKASEPIVDSVPLKVSQFELRTYVQNGKLDVHHFADNPYILNLLRGEAKAAAPVASRAADIAVPARSSASAFGPAPGSVSAWGPEPEPIPPRSPVPVPALGPAPAPVPALGSAPAPIPARGSALAPIPARGSALAPIPARGPEPESVPPRGPALAPALGSAPAPALGSAPAPVPARGPEPAPVPALSSAPTPVPSLSSVLAPVPALGSAPTRVPVPRDEKKEFKEGAVKQMVLAVLGAAISAIAKEPGSLLLKRAKESRAAEVKAAVDRALGNFPDLTPENLAAFLEYKVGKNKSIKESLQKAWYGGVTTHIYETMLKELQKGLANIEIKKAGPAPPGAGGAPRAA